MMAADFRDRLGLDSAIESSRERAYSISSPRPHDDL